MDGATATAAISEAVVFLEYFKDLADPRQRGKAIHPLGEVLLLCLLAVLAGAETIVDIARAPVSAVLRWDAVSRLPR